MADYSTALIAAITVMAGWGACVIAGSFRTRELNHSQRREDAALTRAKVDELFSELDALQTLSSEQIVTAVGILERREAADSKIEKINLGRIRSLATIYFPHFAAMITVYDENCIKLLKTLRTDIKNEGIDKINAMYDHIVEAGQLTYIYATTCGYHSQK